MSQENVEIVRKAFEASDAEAASEWWHPEIEWVVAKEHPEVRTLNGREAVTEYIREWGATLADMSLEIHRFVASGATVVAVGAVRGTGIGSGADMQVAIAFLCTLAESKIIHVEEYLNPADALTVSRLEE